MLLSILDNSVLQINFRKLYKKCSLKSEYHTLIYTTNTILRNFLYNTYRNLLGTIYPNKTKEEDVLLCNRMRI